MNKEQLNELNALFGKKEALESTLKEIDDQLSISPDDITALYVSFGGKDDRRKSINLSRNPGAMGVIDEAYKVFLMVAKTAVVTELDHVQCDIDNR